MFFDLDDIEMRMAKTSIKPEDIFTDDEEEEEEPQPQEPEQSDALELEDDIMEEVEQDKVEETNENSNTSSPATSVVSSPVSSTPGKTKRKVLRKKTTKNARGLLGKYIYKKTICTLYKKSVHSIFIIVTEEVWEWEEVDESEVPKSKPIPTISVKPKAASSSKSTPKKTGNTKGAGQTNLFSFFKKS